MSNEKDDLYNREEYILNQLKACSLGIIRGQSRIKNIWYFLFFSWIFTGLCIPFLFLAPKETVGPFFFFGFITLLGHLSSFFTKLKIRDYEEERGLLEKELRVTRKKSKKRNKLEYKQMAKEHLRLRLAKEQFDRGL